MSTCAAPRFLDELAAPRACKPATAAKRVHNTTQFAKAQAPPPAKEPASTTRMPMEHAPPPPPWPPPAESALPPHTATTSECAYEKKPILRYGQKIASTRGTLRPYPHVAALFASRREQGTRTRDVEPDAEAGTGAGAGAQKRHTSRPNFCPCAVNHLSHLGFSSHLQLDCVYIHPPPFPVVNKLNSLVLTGVTSTCDSF